MKSEYCATVFQLIPEHIPTEFYILTGWNPLGENACYADNLARDQEIEKKIVSLEHFRVIGMSLDERHAEPSWGIVCTEEFALNMAAVYRQEAVFHVLNDELTLVSADGKDRDALGSWKDRIFDPRKRFVFSIHVGCRAETAKIEDSDRRKIISLIEDKFPSFSIFDGEGHFNSHAEETVIINIATDQPEIILSLSHELRLALNQDGIGIQCRGIYQRVTIWSDDRMLLNAWGF